METNERILRDIHAECSNITYYLEKNNVNQERLLKRMDYLVRQMELTNNILLESIQSEDREELHERINILMGRGYSEHN